MNTRNLMRWALCALIALSIPAIYVYAATQTECANAWDESSADDSCKDETITVNNAGKCNVKASCRRHYGYPVATQYWAAEYTGTTNQIKSLHNCQGELKENSC